ncbi:MAG: HRDC domain-containing protein, partial [Muribaculaceae bacterium]|nr:HRDC domain-containing protein [Muribaculaceae bacterium]
QQQLRRMASQKATPEAVYDRLKASATYFINQLDPIVDFLRSLPQEIDSKEARKKFEEAMAMVEYEINLKYALFQAILKKKLTSKEFMKIKREVSMEDPKWVKPESKTKIISNADIENPELYQKLVRWRSRKAEEEEVPAYVILGNKSLVFLANERPQTEADLLAIPGIGRMKAATYGSELLDILMGN